ncbi:acetyltransferase [Thaumasiovibrio sp. DFM-14]|uniref:acetyltransferase n=1 Tax=Thaumasiovibrio sp. DFM-14 TaxID=3384792 RepID=UPI0039A19BBB
MFLKDTKNGDLFDVVDMTSLTNPFSRQVVVQPQAGEDLSDPVSMDKSELVFPSGEGLPECWRNGHYRY